VTAYRHRSLRVAQMFPVAGAHQYVASIILDKDAECLTSKQVDALIADLRACQANARKGQG
jgi:hypothetical protein